tara:strand:+ start:619 stop:1293 length:675 start_codon:yes stop_codon:yes gene_type:complete
MGMISRLDAINHMLLMAGESMVDNLDVDTGGMDTEVCQGVLDRVLTDFQFRGLANNKYIKKFRLTSDGKIFLGNGVLSAELISDHNSTDNYRIIGVARSDTDTPSAIQYLFNVTDQSDRWKKDTDYHVEMVVKIEWKDLDSVIQRAIVAQAARQYQLIMQGDVEADKYLQELEVMYTTRGRAADVDDKRQTIFGSGTRRLRDIHRRAGSYNDPSRFRYWRTHNG